MTAQQVQPTPPPLGPTLEAAAASLITQNFAVIRGHTLRDTLGLAGPPVIGWQQEAWHTNVDQDSDWRAFRSCWDRLPRDTYMADNGRYRFRRYGRFDYRVNDDVLRLLPHQPYAQPLSINPLNGNVQRHFDPLEPAFVDSPVLHNLLRNMARIYAAADGYVSNWRIRLHPYRIKCSGTMPGKPTPEGLHRDGVTYIAALMIDRCNVEGGTTRLTRNDGRTLASVTLTEPLDLLMSDDARTMHEVSPIRPLDSYRPAHRDVLVIAFERMDAFMESLEGTRHGTN